MGTRCDTLPPPPEMYQYMPEMPEEISLTEIATARICNSQHEMGSTFFTLREVCYRICAAEDKVKLRAQRRLVGRARATADGSVNKFHP